MEKKETIKDSINYLTEKKILKVKQIPEFPLFNNEKEAKEAFIETVLLVDKTIKDFKWLPEYDKVISWIVTPERKGLFLVGDSGRLKSTITNLILPVLFYQKYGFIVRTVEADKIDDNWGLFNNSPIINIEDMGVEPPINDYGIKREPMNSLVDFCEKKSKILIMTSNLSSAKLNFRYGIRTQDRIDLLCTAIRFEGESLR